MQTQSDNLGQRKGHRAIKESAGGGQHTFLRSTQQLAFIILALVMKTCLQKCHRMKTERKKEWTVLRLAGPNQNKVNGTAKIKFGKSNFFF